MSKHNLLVHLTRGPIPQRSKVFFFAATLALFFASALPSQSQIFTPTPVLYQSGGNIAQAIAVADVNKDGKIDVIVANSGTPAGGVVGVLLGNGDGTFQPAVTYTVKLQGADAIAIGDLNGDGWPDLVVGSNDGATSTPSLSVLLNKGDGTFEDAVGYSASYDIRSVAIADVNGDGKPDVIALSTYPSYTLKVLLGKGDGTLGGAATRALPHGALSLAAADLNGDGKTDLVVVGNNILDVLLNEGEGKFPSQVTFPTETGYSIILGDVNGDGKLDTVIACPEGAVSVLLGNGDGTFGIASLYDTGLNFTWSVAMGDFNGDGKPDLAVSSAPQYSVPDNGKVAVLLNNGHGTFQAPVIYSAGGRDAFSIAVAIPKAGAKPDLVVADGCDGFVSSCPLGGGVAVFLGVPATTTTKVTTSGTPSQFGQAVTFTASITATEGPIPKGIKVAFYNNGSQIGTAKTANGAAKFTTSSLRVGSHAIQAKFPSSVYFKASAGSVTQVVN